MCFTIENARGQEVRFSKNDIVGAKTRKEKFVIFCTFQSNTTWKEKKKLKLENVQNMSRKNGSALLSHIRMAQLFEMRKYKKLLVFMRNVVCQANDFSGWRLEIKSLLNVYLRLDGY